MRRNKLSENRVSHFPRARAKTLPFENEFLSRETYAIHHKKIYETKKPGNLRSQMSNIPADVDQMPAGKEMDELIAEHVMKWRRNSKSDLWITGKGETAILSGFSADADYLQEMGNKLSARGWGFRWEQCVEDGYGADFLKKGQRIGSGADTPTLAFCRAALLVCKKEDEGTA